MRWIANLVFSYFTNLIALILAGQFISGFEVITAPFDNLLLAAATFTAINWFIRPILKMILSPIIFLTLGLFTLVINAGILKFLDILSVNVNISGTESLIYGTLLITGVNILLHFSAKLLFKKD